MLWIPSVEVESANGIREVPLRTRHLMNRQIFLNGEVDDEMANEFMSELLFLQGEEDKPATVYINSPGGNVNSGLMIYDLIQNSKIPLKLVCTGLAASMAAILLAGGKKGNRYILKHSKVMIHEPLITEGVGGSATSIKNISDNILQTRKVLNGILAKHTGKSLEEINQATAYDHYFDAEQAIRFGLCDHVLERIA